MAKRVIYLPPDMDARYTRYQARVNLSAIVQTALGNELDRLEHEPLIIERLSEWWVAQSERV